MSRMKTIGWMLLVIIVIGIVAILTRTPVRAGADAEAVPAAADTSPPADTGSTDSAGPGGAGDPCISHSECKR